MAIERNGHSPYESRGNTNYQVIYMRSGRVPNLPCAHAARHYIRRVYKIGAMPKVLLFIKFGLIRLLPWRPLNCAPWFRAIKLKISEARGHHEFPRLRKYRFAAREREPSLSPVDARRGYLLGLRKSNFKQEWQNKRHEALTRHGT